MLSNTLPLSFCGVTGEWVFAATRSDGVAIQGVSDDKEDALGRRLQDESLPQRKRAPRKNVNVKGSQND